MLTPTEKINNFLAKYDRVLILCLVIIFISLISLLLIQKYQDFGYNALDLGIYNQVFYNSAQGNLFAMSIHPHSYLGDHFEIFILLLLPIYYIWQSPITLLILQVIFLGLSAWPLYLISRKYLKSIWPLVIVVFFLINPIVLNLLFFEFHILPFSIFTLLFTFYFYQANKFTPFVIFSILSLLVREDVALVIMMFSLLAAVDKKNKKWILFPLVAGGIWFISALKLTGYFNQYGDYKFLLKYGWIGTSLPEMIYNILAKPWQIIKQLISLNNFLSFIAIFIPVLMLPLLKIKYFIPVLLIGLQLFLLSPSTTILIDTHYTATIIPFLYIALIFSLAGLLNKQNAIYIHLHKYKSMIIILLVATVIYSFITLSPIWPALTDYQKNTPPNQFIQEKIDNVQTDENIVASFNFLSNLSNREQVYSLHYEFFGKKQFSEEDFRITAPIDKAFIDFDDLTIYYVQTKYNDDKEKQYPTGSQRINSLLADNQLGLTDIFDSYAYYKKEAAPKYQLVEINKDIPDNNTGQELNAQLQLSGIEKNPSPVTGTLGLSFHWRAKAAIDDDYFLLLKAKDNNKIIYEKIYPLGYLLYPTSDWPLDQMVTTNYWFYLPGEISDRYSSLEFQVIQITSGQLTLDGRRSTKLVISGIEDIGPAFTVDYNTL